MTAASDLLSPEHFAAPYEAFALMRQNDPLYWHEQTCWAWLRVASVIFERWSHDITAVPSLVGDQEENLAIGYHACATSRRRAAG